MATYVLLNTIKFGSNLLKSGSVIDDACYDTAGIGTAGGLLTVTGNVIIDAAATAVQGWWKSGSRDQQVCDAAMLAAYGLAGQTYELAHDTVAVASTGVTTTAGAAHSHSITSTGASSPAITVAKVREQQHFPAVPAAGTNYHASYAAGAPLADATGPFTRFVPPRTVQIARGGAGNATVYTITGTDPNGGVITENINSNGASTVQGVQAYTTITAISSDVNPGVTTTFQTGAGFGIGVVVSDIDACGIDGALEGAGTKTAATGTYIPSTAPNGAHHYTVAYRVLPTATNAAHDHGAATGSESTHTHPVSDPTHSHALT